jgi:hypothetical protein
MLRNLGIKYKDEVTIVSTSIKVFNMSIKETNFIIAYEPVQLNRC